MSKWTGSKTCILAYIFDSTSRQCLEVWASNFPFLHSTKASIHPSEACLLDASTGPWHRLTTTPPSDCPSSQSVWRVPEPSKRLGSSLLFRNGMCQSLVVSPFQRSITLILSMMVIRVTGSKWEVHLQVPLTLGKGSHGGCHSWCFTVFVILICCAGWYPFLNSWISRNNNTFNSFVFNMVKGHNLQLRYDPPLFHNFRQFNIKASPAHHFIIQKEMDELLAKGAIEQSTGGAGFSSQHILSFLGICVAYIQYSTLNDLIAICTYLFLRCLLWDRYSNLFNREIMLFLFISRMLIYIFPLLSITITFYSLFDNTNLINGKFAFWAAYCP